MRGHALTKLARTGFGLLACAAVICAGVMLVFAQSGSSATGPSSTIRAAAVNRASPARASYRKGFVLLAFTQGTTKKVRAADAAAVGGHVIRSFIGGTQLLSVHRDVLSAIKTLRSREHVRFAEPDYLNHEDAAPNDSSFGLQWGHRNTGQTVNGTTGTAGSDERSVPAWDVTTGSRSNVIAEVDSGVDYNHPDLAANIWSNPGGVGGCPAGTHGYNVLTSTCDPMDDETPYGGHGTHVAGILGAVGNNARGVAGVNWATTILPVKWLDSAGNGSTSGLISALNWVLQAQAAGVNIRVINDSATWKGTAFSQALSDEIDLLGQHNILFVTAAGNTGDDNDNLSVRRYPCGYDRPTEICVTASDQNDALPSWANYGRTTVDLAAPGDQIYSTLRNGTYGYVSGGSMASPQVAGAAALILSTGDLSTVALKAQILNNVDPVAALTGRVRTGGRLDICKAIPACASAPPPPATFGQTAVGPSADPILADRKRVNRYQLPSAGSVTKLSIYLQPGGTSGSQQIKGALYADSGGAPGALLGVTSPITFQSTQAAGWYDLTFPAPVALQAGNYWIGMISGSTSHVAAFRYTSVSGSRDYNVNSYAAGPSNPFGTPTVDGERMSEYATYTAGGGGTPAPVSSTPPTITGQPQQGQTLTTSNGTWQNSPTGFTYQWLTCTTSCSPISGASANTYTPTAGDVGKTVEATVTATNAGGSTPATSAPTPTIQAAATSATFGTTTVGGSSDPMLADRKRVNRYQLPAAGSATKLTIYLQPAGTSGSQAITGILYADNSGSPGALLGKTTQLTFASTQAGGWYDLPFASPVALPAGNYWIGMISGSTSHVAAFRFTSVTGSRDYNVNPYSSAPTNPFGTPTVDNERMSEYATYTANTGG
jgi:subtilisin family serine protease